MGKRLNQDRQRQLQPARMEYALEKIRALGFTVINDDIQIKFLYKGHIVHFYPYSGWHTGKTIRDGRGIDNLLKQIR